MTISVDVDVMRQHRLGLLAEATEVARRSMLDPPEAGELSAPTAVALERLSARVGRLAGHLGELADAIDQWLVVAHATDGSVAVGVDLLTSGVLAL